MVGKTARLGIALAALVGLGFGTLWSGRAAFAGVVFGLLATALQTAAVHVMQPAIGGGSAVLFKRYGAGMGLRLIGVIAIPIAVVLDRSLFAPLPSAFGYLGVLVPLLFFETRLFR